MGFPCLLDWLCSIKSVSLWVNVAKFTVSVEKQQWVSVIVSLKLFSSNLKAISKIQCIISKDMFKIKNFLLTKYFPVFSCSYWM